MQKTNKQGTGVNIRVCFESLNDFVLFVNTAVDFVNLTEVRTTEM